MPRLLGELCTVSVAQLLEVSERTLHPEFRSDQHIVLQLLGHESAVRELWEHILALDLDEEFDSALALHVRDGSLLAGDDASVDVCHENHVPRDVQTELLARIRECEHPDVSVVSDFPNLCATQVHLGLHAT